MQIIPNLQANRHSERSEESSFCGAYFAASAHSRKLLQKAHVVLEKRLNVVNAVLEHRQPIHAHSESETTHFFRVVIHEAVHGWINHARAEKLNPAGAFAFPAGRTARASAAAATENARDIKFHRRLGKREIARPKTRLHTRAKILFNEIFDGAGEIAKSDVGIDRQSFNLVKHERMRGVRVITAINLAGDNHAHRWLALFHGANLHRRSMRT